MIRLINTQPGHNKFWEAEVRYEIGSRFVLMPEDPKFKEWAKREAKNA